MGFSSTSLWKRNSTPLPKKPLDLQVSFYSSDGAGKVTRPSRMGNGIIGYSESRKLQSKPLWSIWTAESEARVTKVWLSCGPLSKLLGTSSRGHQSCDISRNAWGRSTERDKQWEERQRGRRTGLNLCLPALPLVTSQAHHGTAN